MARQAMVGWGRNERHGPLVGLRCAALLLVATLSALAAPVCAREEQSASNVVKVIRNLPVQSIVMTSLRMSRVLTLN